MESGVRVMVTFAALIVAVPVLFCAQAEGQALAQTESGSSVLSVAYPEDAPGGGSAFDAGQSQPQATMPSGPDRLGTTPKAELFLGYSYLRGVPTLSQGNRLVWLNGGSTSIAFNLNHFFGLVGDFGGFADSELNLTGPGANPARIATSGGTVYTYLGGPRFSYRRSQRLVPFAQALFGGVHASPVTLSGCTGASCIPLPSQNAFALTAGAGLDLRVRRHLSLRVVQAEYLMTRFADPTTGNRSMQNDLRLSAGLVYSMGGSSGSGPLAYSCAATPTSVYAGDPVSVTGTALNLEPKRNHAYGWRADGGKISGTSAVANIDTSGVAPGNYTAQGHVSESSNHGRFADCSAAYTVMAFQAPTVSCSANPATGRPGDTMVITAQANSPQNRPLTFRYTASAGSISGNASTATLSTAAVPLEPINITCTVADDKGQTASANTTVTLVAPSLPAAPQTQKLCSIKFERDSRRPTRVDNEAKACLDEVALNLQRSPEANLALLGKGQPKEAAQRTLNARRYLVEDKGIAPSRVMVYTEPSADKVVDTIMIPFGADLDMTGLSPLAKR